jgi:two-component system sensor histidine kinase VanS
VAGDPGRLARVFDNVLRNAVSYSKPGTEVELNAWEEDGWALVSISNEGLEIPEGELSSIFQKFYRLDEARSTRTGGAGLGLAIAREIVEHHGGTIQAESTGKRTVFTVRLPGVN